MLERIAPRNVIEVIAQPMAKPMTTLNDRKRPMICSFISAPSLASASSVRVQAR